METFLIAIVAILFLLAISDLVVGVSNDAVNFLNSAIGSKVAPFWLIMVIASLGVLVGATFSSGMMEVARKGIFHPQHFYLTEIMIIFLAVMITDVILLDVFNTFGMPTSTTVSIVFELLGAAVAVSILKIYNDPNAGDLSQYINSAKALAIITGILVSVVVSFSVGALIQYLTRLAFTFNFMKNIKYYGALWGGAAITAITYFILIKGMKGSTYAEIVLDSGITINQWLKAHTYHILLYGFLAWSALLQGIYMLTKFNVLKAIVLIGTFALAMAFAGNDLVNFIGVPIAGYESYQAFIKSGATDPGSFLMSSMQGKVATPVLFLLIAGLIMVITLWLSKKARSVVKTSLDLSNQDEVDERFGSSYFARSIVRGSIKMNHRFQTLVPDTLSNAVAKRFDTQYFNGRTPDGEEKVSFDLVRASVNLVVASVLIALGTSLKLPLSTTYVTFMVAMGTSLADKAWGRESAVYRVTGVLAVISGWFFTALIAFTIAFIIALFISWGEVYALGALLVLATVIIYRTHALHHKKDAEATTAAQSEAAEVLKKENIVKSCTSNVTQNLIDFTEVYGKVIDGLKTENRKQLLEISLKVNDLNERAKKLKSKVFKTIKKLEYISIDTGPYYVQVLDYLREMAHCLTFIAKPSYEHVNNNHRPLADYQIRNLEKINDSLNEMVGEILTIIETNDYDQIGTVYKKQEELLSLLKKLRKEHIRALKADSSSGTRSSLLYFNLIYETQNFTLHSINLLKSQRDFIVET